MELSSPTAGDYSALLRADGLEVFFSTDRVGNDPDIWHATRARASDPFSSPTPVTGLSTSSTERPSAISVDSEVLYFHSQRNGDDDLWMVTRSCQSRDYREP